ncbi:hypothetical protein [Nonomuraea rhodomycinica]|uniref:hypothetical protein n=1 Tax=Nonomuraea rhodomycinica TaxID=1712872 RepID=UPI001C37B8C9|nr:hypothetical protein [Nonomuraea rhodomycinica]
MHDEDGRAPLEQVRRIARAVLYEGYLLWPYRQSALKNRHRWTIGGVHPEPYGREHDGHPWLMRTQCLVQAGAGASVDVRVRYLHVVVREPALVRDGLAEPVPELVAGGVRVLPREEATEREAAACGLALEEVARRPVRAAIEVPAGQEMEPLPDPGPVTRGRPAGAVVRHWEALRGHVEVSAEPLEPGLFRLTADVVNTTPWPGGTRTDLMRRTLVSAHTVLHARGGRFVSLMDPPEELRAHAEGCRGLGAWPVLVGEEGERDTMLSAPIILYDHPRISPESPGDLFDATEIDQLLTLSVLALSEEEKREIREGDPRGREILERCAGLTPEQLMRLHGVLRADPS